MPDRTKRFLDGNGMDVICLDFAKAFHTVSHFRLCLKLQTFGIGGKFILWIKNFMSNRRQRVVLEGAESPWSSITSGIPQRSVLGRVLFLCYINDLPDQICSLPFMYADDTKVAREIMSQFDEECLQKDLDSLCDWSRLWQMNFNAVKCKTVHYSDLSVDAAHYMMISDAERTGEVRNELELIDVEKDLGVWFDTGLKSRSHIDTAVTKAKKILGLIGRSFKYMGTTILKQLFVALDGPHLEYGNAVWYPQF